MWISPFFSSFLSPSHKAAKDSVTVDGNAKALSLSQSNQSCWARKQIIRAAQQFFYPLFKSLAGIVSTCALSSELQVPFEPLLARSFGPHHPFLTGTEIQSGARFPSAFSTSGSTHLFRYFWLGLSGTLFSARRMCAQRRRILSSQGHLRRGVLYSHWL